MIDSQSNKCQAGPIIEISHDVDLMMHTRNCKTLHEYLNKDKFDVELLHRMVREYFGEDNVKTTEDALEAYFQRDILTLRQYFTLLDATVAEKYQLEEPDIRHYQRQECFILANNFVGPETVHADMFVSRVLVPMLNVLENVKT